MRSSEIRLPKFEMLCDFGEVAKSFHPQFSHL